MTDDTSALKRKIALLLQGGEAEIVLPLQTSKR